MFYLWNCRRRCIFCRTPIFCIEIVFYVLPKKPGNKHLLATRDYYFIFKTFFSQVNNRIFFFVIHPLNSMRTHSVLINKCKCPQWFCDPSPEQYENTQRSHKQVPAVVPIFFDPLRPSEIVTIFLSFCPCIRTQKRF